MRQTIQLTEEQVHRKLAKEESPLIVYGVVILVEYPIEADLSMDQVLHECERSITFCSEVLIGEGTVCAVLNQPSTIENAEDLNALKASFEKELTSFRRRVEFAYRFHTEK